jgi:DNA-binding MarR family transcriptional regulator
MSDDTAFKAAMRDWMRETMHNSMHGLVHFAKANNLSLSQMTTLTRIYHGKVSCTSEIHQDLGISNPAASQMIDKLVTLGLVSRAEDPLDRRGHLLNLTDRGRVLMSELSAVRLQWVEEISAILSAEQRQTSAASLALLVDTARSVRASKTQTHK